VPEEEFVTVSEAARALGLSERQVRRYALQLGPTDKRQDPKRQHKGQPVGLVSLEALRKATEKDITTEKPSGTDNGQPRGMPVESTGKASGVPVEPAPVAPVDLLERISEAEKRAAVLEAERDGLTARLADAQKAALDTASDRDAWKEQAQTLTEALRAAQDEARAARLIGGRPMQQIEAQNLTAGDSGASEASGGGITTPSASEEPKRGFWARLRGRG
jgi:hypothetical protein